MRGWHDTGNGRLHEEKGTLPSFFDEGAKHFHFWAVTNTFQGDTWIFGASDPDMKRALITENYGVQKSLIVLYPLKHLHNHNYPRWNSVCFATLWQFKTLNMSSE
jgi:hypothetical protein